jgi:aminoacylase
MNCVLQKHSLNPIESEQAIERLCQLIRFPTVSSIAAKDGIYVQCATWLYNELKRVSVFDSVFLLIEAPDHSPVVVAVWKGVDPSLPIILLNSHYDVVPAIATDWVESQQQPFSGLRKDSKIYGRGTQDMKSVCIQYIEAIRKIMKLYPQYQPQRSIYLTFVPDEGKYKIYHLCFTCLNLKLKLFHVTVWV